MDYYNEIKNKLIDNEIYNKVKDYSKEKHKVVTYYDIGKLLYEAGKSYGKDIIRQYAEKLMVEVGKKYNERTLRRMRQLYLFFERQKWSPMGTRLTVSHIRELFTLKNPNEINYYNFISNKLNLTRDELRLRIKNNEYERLDDETKSKLIAQEPPVVTDFIKNPIIIKNRNNYDVVSEKVLQQLILEDIPSFLKELGSSFCFIENEYKIKIGTEYNYIDLLLYNIEFNCYVVVELKVTSLKKEYIGQIEVYMNYIDKHLKSYNQDKTIGIIICKKDNKFIMEYCSDNRIFAKEYIIS